MTKGESPANTLDIAGEVFYWLTATERLKKQAANRAFYWRFKCRCGKTCEIAGYKAKNGDRKDCGCGGFRRDRANEMKRMAEAAFRDEHPSCS